MKKIIILGHENPDVDSIVSGYLLEKILLKKGYNVEFVIPDENIEEETLSICLRNNLNPKQFMKEMDFNDKTNKYILVDHNERNVLGEIICIIDHHPTSKEINMKHYYNKKISSTAILISKDNENLLNEYDLKLAILATLVDTASFHSTKGKEEDQLWVKNICEKYNIDYNKLYKEGLYLTQLEDINKESVHGLKKYNFDNKIIESSYIQIENPQLEKNLIDQIINFLRKRVVAKKLDGFVFIVFDMTKFETDYYFITETEVSSNHLEKYVSRGNDIMPTIEHKIK